MVFSLAASTRRRRLFSIWTLLFIISSAFFFGLMSDVQAALGDDKPQTEAVSVILFDAHRGQTIYSKVPDEASHSPLANRITAVMLTLEKADQEALITASKDAANTENATLKLTVGEKYTVKNLLSALLLTGSPDAAIAIAEHVGGSETGFVAMMNEYALGLGMKNTHFTNCTGVYDENQVTTIEDIVVLMKYALKNDGFNRIFGTQAKPWYDKDKTSLLTNTNNMFWSYQGTDGGVAGGFGEDVQSIVTTATKNNMRLVCVLLDVPAKSMYTDSINIFSYGFDNYLLGTLVYAGSSQKVVTIDNQSINLVPVVDVQYIYPKGQSFIKEIKPNIDESKLKPPITKNTVVGMMTYTLMDGTVINVELYPDREILPQKTTRELLEEKLKENMELVYVVLALILLEIIIIISKIMKYTRNQVIKARVRKKSRGRFS